PHYMSPEQASGDRAVGPATDIWALGCVLYEMLTGTPPFTGGSAQAVMSRIMTGEVESTTVHRRTVPAEVDAALLKALERVPTDRFASAGDFADVLAGRVTIDLPRGSPGRASSPPGRIAVYVAVLGVVATAAWALGAGTQVKPNPMRVADVFPPGQELVEPGQLRLSADGATLAYTGPGEGTGGWRLWIRRWSDLDGNGRPLPGTENIDDFDLSPTGDELAFVAEGSVRILNLASSVTRTLMRPGAECCLTWSDGGDWLYYTNESGGLSRVSVEDGGEEVLTSPGPGLLGYQWPAPVPGTDLLVFEVAELFGRGSQIALLDMTTGEVDTLGQGSHPVPFGDQILFTTAVRSAELWSMDFRGGGRASRPIVTGLGGDLEEGRGAFDASPAGHIAYSRAAPQAGPTRTPVWVERDGTSRLVDPNLTGRFRRVRLSPDGARFLLWGPDGIHVKDLSEGPVVRLLSLEEPRHRPSWSPDGLEIFYSVIRDEKTEVMRMRADGSLPPRGTGLESPEATMTRDSSWWVFRTPNFPEAPDLMTVPADLASEPVPLVATDASESQPAISRDGRWFAFSSDFSGGRQVYVRSFPSADVQIPITLRSGEAPLFSPTRDELFVVDEGWLVAVSYATDPTFRVTGRERLFEVAGYGVGGDPSSSHHYDISRDGSRFMMLRDVGTGSSMEPSVVLLLNVMTVLGGQASP
ncbi:MAG: hypothetical protein HKO53_20395, partial [Gemmatimonadetes bacterium]|nr:hypothetical protein [Gemmatimonadota bacterium]